MPNFNQIGWIGEKIFCYQIQYAFLKEASIFRFLFAFFKKLCTKRELKQKTLSNSISPFIFLKNNVPEESLNEKIVFEFNFFFEKKPDWRIDVFFKKKSTWLGSKKLFFHSTDLVEIWQIIRPLTLLKSCQISAWLL